MDATEGTRQNVQLYKGTISAKNIKLTVSTAFDLFIAIYHLEVQAIERLFKEIKLSK